MGEDCPLGQTKSCRKYGKIIKKTGKIGMKIWNKSIGISRGVARQVGHGGRLPPRTDTNKSITIGKKILRKPAKKNRANQEKLG